MEKGGARVALCRGRQSPKRGLDSRHGQVARPDGREGSQALLSPPRRSDAQNTEGREPNAAARSYRCAQACSLTSEKRKRPPRARAFNYRGTAVARDLAS